MDHKVMITAKQKTIPSPCTGVCTMDLQNEYCIGCYRSRMEIGGWMHMDDAEKVSIIKQLRKRRKDDTGK